MSVSDDMPTSTSLRTVPVHFHAGMFQVALERVRRDYDRYRGLVVKPDHATVREDAEDADLDASLKTGLLLGHAGGAGDETKKVLAATRSHATTVGHNVPVSK